MPPMDLAATAPAPKLSSTQIGAIGEVTVAAGLMLGSSGRLAPFRPMADDDGLDLLVLDKVTRRVLPIQVKCRTGIDRSTGGTVEFNVRLQTFTKEGGGFLLFALLSAGTISTAWLVPADELEAIAYRKSDKLAVVASPKPTSKDRFSPYRHGGMEEVVSALLARLDG